MGLFEGLVVDFFLDLVGNCLGRVRGGKVTEVFFGAGLM